LVETFLSHLDGGLGSWDISVADNFTMESQTLWHGSRLLRNDWIRKQTFKSVGRVVLQRSVKKSDVIAIEVR
jgi:hypothetical protein